MRTGSVSGSLPFGVYVLCYLILDKGDDGFVVAGQERGFYPAELVSVFIQHTVPSVILCNEGGILLRQLFQISEGVLGAGRLVMLANGNKQVNVDALTDCGNDPVCPDDTVFFQVQNICRRC